MGIVGQFEGRRFLALIKGSARIHQAPYSLYLNDNLVTVLEVDGRVSECTDATWRACKNNVARK